MKNIELIQVSNEHYPLDIEYDEAYQIVNENKVPICVIFVSQTPFSDALYVEWIELLSFFRCEGYLRHIFNALKEKTSQTRLEFQCGDEKLRKKYLAIGCKEHGISDVTGCYMMTY